MSISQLTLHWVKRFPSLEKDILVTQFFFPFMVRDKIPCHISMTGEKYPLILLGREKHCERTVTG